MAAAVSPSIPAPGMSTDLASQPSAMRTAPATVVVAQMAGQAT